MCSRFRLLLSIAVLGLISCFSQAVVAQSSDQSLPTPVLSNQINGTIRALDLGDPRLTRHFYAFDGNPGDLIITLDSQNLNGDVDVFTAITFRPLTKISMYAEAAKSQVTKSIYLRGHQIFILRVEARTPNDDPGSYSIQFSGSFQPFSGGIPVAENSESRESETTRKSNVSSVGATIERPAEPVSEAKQPEPPPAETEKPAPTPAPRAVGTSRNTRGRSTRSTRGRPASRTTTPTKTETAKTEPEKTETQKAEETKPAAVEEKAASPTEEKPAPAKTIEKPPESAGPRLIIERTDGNNQSRPMSTVRRVVIEGGVIVVTLKNGRIERIPLSSVARMAIEP